MSETSNDTSPGEEGNIEAPEQIQVAPEAIARWSELDDDAPLNVSLTKADFDHLLLGLRSLSIGQSHLVSAVTGHINQDMEACAQALLAADQLCVASYNRINAFITVLMLSAQPVLIPQPPADGEA